MISIRRYILNINNKSRYIKISTNYIFYSSLKSYHDFDKINNISQNKADTNYISTESYFNHHVETSDNFEETYEQLRKSAIQNHRKSQYLLGILLTQHNISNQISISEKNIESANSAIEVKNDIIKVKKLNTMMKNKNKKPGINVVATRNSSQNSSCNYIITIEEVMNNEVNEAKANEIIQVTGNVLLYTTNLEKENIGMYWLMRASQNKYYPAMCYLGNILLNNLDTISYSPTKQNVNHAKIYLEKAMEWYSHALQSNCSEQNIVSEAAFNLGVLYYNGIHIPLLPTTTTTTITASCNNTDHQLYSNYSKCDLLQIDRKLSFEYFKQAANLGEQTSQLWCGYCYATGEGCGETSINPMLALKYLNLASSGNETKAKAHFYLAQIYRSGLNDLDNTTENKINVDSTLFTFHLHESFILRDVDASFCLADMHFNKYTNDKDCLISNSIEDEYLVKDLLASKMDSHLLRAIELYEKASNAGHAEASLCLGAITYQNLLNHHHHQESNYTIIHDESNSAINSNWYHKTPQNAKRKAFELYNLAAEQGSKDAWRNIASMYYLGDGVPKCEATAKEIMRVIFGKK